MVRAYPVTSQLLKTMIAQFIDAYMRHQASHQAVWQSNMWL